MSKISSSFPDTVLYNPAALVFIYSLIASATPGAFGNDVEALSR